MFLLVFSFTLTILSCSEHADWTTLPSKTIHSCNSHRVHGERLQHVQEKGEGISISSLCPLQIGAVSEGDGVGLDEPIRVSGRGPGNGDASGVDVADCDAVRRGGCCM